MLGLMHVQQTRPCFAVYAIRSVASLTGASAVRGPATLSAPSWLWARRGLGDGPRARSG